MKTIKKFQKTIKCLFPDFILGKILNMRKALSDLLVLLIRHPSEESVNFARLFLKVQPNYTMVQNSHLIKLFRLVQEVNRNDIPGDIVECGVWNGGSAAIMAVANKSDPRYYPLRTIWLFDSFQGLPRPGEKDGVEEQKAYFEGWNKGDIKKVNHILNRLKISSERVKIVEGWFDKTLESAAVSDIAILHIDADWYASVKKILDVFYPKVVPGGFVIFDDYGHWRGCDQAVADYILEHGLNRKMIVPIGSVGAFLQKPSEEISFTDL
jgi:O-methyltransferase